MKDFRKILFKNLPLMVVSSLLVGCAMEIWLPGEGNFSMGWTAASFLFLISEFILLILWKLAGAGRILAWMVTLTFFLRLGSGVALTILLPVAGYGSADELAGHVFTDAHNRDQAAWELAQSGESILTSFTNDFISDQYGGLLALSAGVYRVLSPDGHRPYLIQIVAALASAMGVPFFWAAVRKRWGEKISRTATWILVLYPESILLGSYPMREPFLISLAAICFWAVITWPTQKVKAILVFAAGVIGMVLISSQMAIPITGFCILWLWMDQIGRTKSVRWKAIGWSGFGLLILIIVAFTWKWLILRTNYDIHTTVQNSGIIQSLATIFGGRNSPWIRLFVVFYGLLQPVLPAALVDPAPLLWQIIGILRSLGWYIILPFMGYSIFWMFKSKVGVERQKLVLVVAMIWAWMVISSMRGGGDQWDNPRYRVVFLPWMALLVGWVLAWLGKNKDSWFWRLVAVEVVFVVAFLIWYISRYYPSFEVLSFSTMVIIIAGLTFLILSGGLLWDHFYKKKGSRS
jgi:hypothetical protein